MSRAFELRPLLLAALVGAGLLWSWGYFRQATGDHRRDLVIGAGLGAGVQIGVRLLGVS